MENVEQIFNILLKKILWNHFELVTVLSL